MNAKDWGTVAAGVGVLIAFWVLCLITDTKMASIEQQRTVQQ